MRIQSILCPSIDNAEKRMNAKLGSARATYGVDECIHDSYTHEDKVRDTFMDILPEIESLFGSGYNHNEIMDLMLA